MNGKKKNACATCRYFKGMRGDRGASEHGLCQISKQFKTARSGCPQYAPTEKINTQNTAPT